MNRVKIFVGCVMSTMALAGSPGQALPAEEDENNNTFTIYLDNDVLLPPQNEDRNYTMGLAFEVAGPVIEKSFVKKPLDWVDARMPLDLARSQGQGNGYVYSMQLGETAFTPLVLDDPNVIPNDRPYASLLYLSTRHKRYNQPRERAISTELEIGILGTSIAEQFQDWWHERLRSWRNSDTPEEPLGWSHQISDGGEPTFRYTVTLQQKLDTGSPGRHGSLNHDLQVYGDVSVGYYTNASLGMAFRAGRYSDDTNPWWSYNAKPIHATSLYSLAGIEGKYDRKSGWFGWLGARTTLWAYNVLLQGQFRHSDHTFSGSDIERLTYELSGGLSYIGRKCSITYAVYRRSPEFKGPVSRHHSWAGIYLSIPF